MTSAAGGRPAVLPTLPSSGSWRRRTGGTTPWPPAACWENPSSLPVGRWKRNGRICLWRNCLKSAWGRTIIPGTTGRLRSSPMCCRVSGASQTPWRPSTRMCPASWISAPSRPSCGSGEIRTGWCPTSPCPTWRCWGRWACCRAIRGRKSSRPSPWWPRPDGC